MKESLHLLGFPGTFRLNATVPPSSSKPIIQRIGSPRAAFA
jgi:hypothetical protein